MRLFILVFALFLFAAPAFAQDAEPEPVTEIAAAEAIDPYDPAAVVMPGDDLVNALGIAWQAYQDGDWERSARYYLFYLKHDPTNEQSLYNLACCYGLLGETELAVKYIEYAYDNGFTDTWHIRNDTDMELVKDDPLFTELLDRLDEQQKEKAVELGQVVYFEAPTMLRGRLYLPDDYDPVKQYRLIVGLHGFGSQPDRYIRLWKRFETMDFIYLVPQAPYPFISGADTVGYSWGFWIEGEGLPPQTWTMSMDYLAGVIEQTRGLYPINEVYLFGFSQGAGMSLTAGIANHQLIDGIIAFGGWLDTNILSDDMLALGKKERVFLAHGTSDAVVKIQNTLDALEKLEEFGYDVTLFEFDGGHEVPEEAVHAAYEWMNEEPEEEEEE